MKKKIMTNSAAALAAQFIAIIYGFVLPRLILEQFGSEINGLTQSIKQFLGVISFLDLGVGQVVRSAMYRPLADNDHRQLSRVMASGRKFYRRLALGLAVYALVLTGIYPFIAQQDFGWLYTATLIAAMAISSFAEYYFGIVNEQLLHADQRSYIVSVLQIAGNLLNLVVCIWLLRAGSPIQTVKLAASLIFLIRPLTMQWYVRRHYRIEVKIRYDVEPVAQKWNGIAQHISAVVLDGTDTIVLTMMSTLSNVSVYSVYYMVIASIQRFYQAATAGVQAAAGALWADGDEAVMNRMFSRTEMLLHYITVFAFSCTGLLIVPFVRVYAQGLTDVNYHQPLFAALLVLAYAVRCLRTPYNIWILAAGHYRQTQVCHIAAAAINLGVSVIAVSRWGLPGVAVGTLVAMVYQTLWMAVYNSRNLLKRPLGKILKQFAVDALTACTICLLGSRIPIVRENYAGWLLAAVQTALLAVAVIILSVCLFYRKYTAAIVRDLISRRRK